MKITPLENWLAQRIGVHDHRLTREEISRYQLARLQETINLARADSHFYRRHLAGMREKNISTLADLARLPFTTAEDIKQDSLQFVCVSQSEISRVVTLQTSGTTGEPKRVYFTQADQELTVDFFHHAASTLVGPGDRVLILFPGERPGSVGDIVVKALNRLGVVGIPHGLVRDARQTLDKIAQEGVTSLWGIPVQVLALARHRDAMGRPVPLKIKSVLLSTDYVPQAITGVLEYAWGCRVFEHYGTTEMGLGVALECQALAGYHLREADLYFEIINPETGEPVPDGETGEVVFTTLTRRGMPLIRYRTGDLSRFITEPCPCGTVLKRMALVTGRVDGKIEIANSSYITMGQLDEALFPIDGLLDYTATLTSEKGVDCLKVQVKTISLDGAGTLQAVARSIENIPAVAGARKEGRLQLLPVIADRDNELTVGKRKIIDLRDMGGH